MAVTGARDSSEGGLGGSEHNSAATHWSHFGKELNAEVRAEDTKPERQNPHPSNTEECGTRKLYTRRD
jgi:hypothetical protein